MPVYEYSCPSCGSKKEIVESMAQHSSKKIVVCSCRKRMVQVFSGGVYSDNHSDSPKTLGAWADRQHDRLSEDAKIGYRKEIMERPNLSLNKEARDKDAARREAKRQKGRYV